ncbi:MAG TPA: hypothetical protein VGI83_07740 [Gemmatimonadales bacterium]|jgi:hypothetical protein
MAFLRMRTIGVIVTASMLGCAAPGLRGEYGVPGASYERYPGVDSAAAKYDGAQVIVVANSEAPEGSRRAREDEVVFSGTMIPPNNAFLRLLNRGDTLKIGKRSIIGMYLRAPGHSQATASVLVGALIAGLGAWFVVNDASTDVSSGTKLTIIPAAALLGGLIGAVVSPQDERGERIYPAPRPAAPPGQVP